MIDAGRRDTLITFERSVDGKDEYGEDREDWATMDQEWAAINWGRGDERRQAAMEQGSQSATFTVPDSPSTRALTIKDRIICQDAAWDITSSVPAKTWGDRDITAVRNA